MSIATVYARALFESARELHLEKDEKASLADFRNAIKMSRELRIALSGPVISTKEKVAIVRELAKKMQFHELVTEFLCLVARKGRVSSISEICDAYDQVRCEASGGVMGQLVSADVIDQADVANLESAFSKRLGKSVKFQILTNPDLLAGVKVTVQGVTFDGTLRAQLDHVRNKLINGGN